MVNSDSCWFLQINTKRRILFWAHYSFSPFNVRSSALLATRRDSCKAGLEDNTWQTGPLLSVRSHQSRRGVTPADKDAAYRGQTARWTGVGGGHVAPRIWPTCFGTVMEYFDLEREPEIY